MLVELYEAGAWAKGLGKHGTREGRAGRRGGAQIRIIRLQRSRRTDLGE